MYSPPERGMEPPSTPHTIGNPMPARTIEMSVAQMRFPPRYTPTPRLVMTQMDGVRPWFMKPTPKASHMERPRTRPLALRAKASSSAILPPCYKVSPARPSRPAIP